MRVLFINPTFPPDYTGGAEVSLRQTATGLQKLGVDCQLLVLNNRRASEVDQWYRVETLPVRRVTVNKWMPAQEVFDPRFYKITKAQIRLARPDIVHIHNVGNMSLAPFVAAQHEHVPLINTLHDLWLLCPNNMRFRKDGSFCDPKQFPNGCNQCFRQYMYWGRIPKRRWVFQQLTSSVYRFVSPSQALIDRHVEAGYPRQKFQLIPYGFNEYMPSDPRDEAIAQLIRTRDEYRTIVFAGGGAINKGPQVVLDAIPQLLAKYANLRIIVTGGGEPQYLSQFRELQPQVILLSRVDPSDMRLLFSNADLTLVPSTWHENSPVVIYESFQCGTPCVGSNFGGTPELIEEDKTGYLFEVGNAAQMAEKIVRHFQKTPDERRIMRKQSVLSARCRLGLSQHIDSLLKLYKEAIAARTVRG
jgi:glycosyltransferase involved in cell wall biosynthesis